MSRIEGRTHVRTRLRAAPIQKILLASQGASTHAASAFGKGIPVSRVVVVWAAPMEDPPDAFRSAPLGGADLDDPLGLDAYP
jgi:hypothetical protein